jgi:hypothetical protein
MGRTIISEAIVFNGTPNLSQLESLITTYISNTNLDTGWTQLGSILLLMIRYVNSVSGGGPGGLVDGTYGDVTISGGGTIISYNSNSITSNDMAQMPAFTLKGNDTGSAATPQDLTVSEAQIMLSIDDLVTLTGLVEGSTNIGTFTGVGLPMLDGLTIKAAFQTLKNYIVMATTSVSGLMSNTDFQKLAVQTLTDAATINWDASNGNYARVTLSGNRTLALMTNHTIGEFYVLNVTATGSDRTLTFNAAYKDPSGASLGTVTITNGTSRSFAFQAGPTLELHQIGNVNSGGGGTTLTTYSAGNGMIVTATGAGVTFARTSATEWAVTIPDGVDILSGQIYSTTAQNPGTNVFIAFNFGGSRPFNNNTAGTDARPPKIWGINMINNGDGSTPIVRTSNPQSYAATTGATNLVPRLSSVSNGDIEIELQNYTSALGGGASLVFFNF